MTDRRADKHDWVPGSLAMVVTVLVALATLTPYVWNIPQTNLNLITQAQTTLWNGWMVILAYYFGNSAGQRKAADTIAMQAETAKQAGTVLAAATGSSEGITLAPGESATATATEAGTEIKPDPLP